MLIRVALLADLAGELLCNVILDVLEELLGAGQFGGLAHAEKTISVQLYFKEIYIFLIKNVPSVYLSLFMYYKRFYRRNKAKGNSE